MHHTNETAPHWASCHYSIKRHGTSITDCDSEPIRTPGCIQAHGALLVLCPHDLSIQQVSENSAVWLGLAPDQLLGAPVALVVGQAGTDRLRELLDTESTERNPFYAFTLPARGGTGPLDATFHTIDGRAILVFEAA